jgi:hypothetical protein
MKPPEFETWNIAKLHRLLLQRCFAIPKLQRNFVWDAKRAAKLLDSVYRGMPIGSLFLWEMDQKSGILIRQSEAEILPLFSPDNSKIWFVIDGQQRLSVIYQAFSGEKCENDAGREIDFGRLCFVVHPDKEKDSPPRIVYRKPVDRELVPICQILAADWHKRMPSHSMGFLSRIRKCRDQFLKYPLPVVTVRKADLKEIGEVFVRVNSQGMRITSADRAIARIGKLDVRAMAQELRQQVRENVFALGTIDPILMGFNLISERPELDSLAPKLDVMAQHWSNRIEDNPAELAQFRKQWHRYRNAFLSAVDYLHHKFPVYNESFLPSANMLATLSVFFYYHAGQPNPFQAGEICKWFWATGVAKRYSGSGYHRYIVDDSVFFESLAYNKRKYFTFKDYLDPVYDLQNETYNSGSSCSRAFFCLLAAQNPRYLENGENIPLDRATASHSNRKHRHHVFPQAQLRSHLRARFFNSLCNICFLVSRDNQKIGNRLPRTYLADYRKSGRDLFAKVMKSHLIPVGDDSGVWQFSIKAGFKQFRTQRLSLICRAFEREAGIRLFRKT